MASAVTNVNTITLPILNKNYTGINVATFIVTKEFVEIKIDASTGPTSSISILKPGYNSLSFTNQIKERVIVGRDLYNQLPFNKPSSISILIAASPNENVIINSLTMHKKVHYNYQHIVILFCIIFLIVYFVVNKNKNKSTITWR